MALPILQITVDALPLAGIIGLVWREVMKSRKEKKSPGNGKEVNGILRAIQTDINALKASSSTLDKNYAVIAEGIRAWHEKCALHLDAQTTINLEMKGEIKSLDDKIFEIVSKD